MNTKLILGSFFLASAILVGCGDSPAPPANAPSAPNATPPAAPGAPAAPAAPAAPKPGGGW